jgi:uncharacterized protein
MLVFVTMHSQFQAAPDLIFDVRKAAWFPGERVLAVADLHLGYAWAHRLSGQLMPIPPTNDTLGRLTELQREYEPREIVLLGDIVHRAMAIEALETELRELFSALSPHVRLTFLAGNHDRDLARVLKQWSLPIELPSSRAIEKNLLVHGDQVENIPPGHRLIMGHEHPAITIGDGVTTSHKCPCFLVSERVILPAFSRWAAGTNIRAYELMSATAREAKFTQAIAICGDKMLPIAL